MRSIIEGNIHKNFIRFAIPLVLSGLLAQAYALIDTVIAGKFLGEAGLAAIGATTPMISFISSVFWGYTVGASVHVARLFGAGEYHKIRDTVWSQLFWLSVLTVGLGLLCILCKDPLFDFLRVPEEIRDEAFRYFAIDIGGLFLILFSFHAVMFLNAIGITSFSFWMSVLASVLNIGGNLLTVAVFDWGVSGLAIASVFASAVVALCFLCRFRAAFREMDPAGRTRILFRPVREAFPYTVPATFQQMAIYFAGMALSPIVNGIGTAATAAYTVVASVYEFNAEVYQNASKIFGTYVAQSVGADRPELIPKGVKAGLLLDLCFMVPLLLFCAFFPDTVCSLFFRGDEIDESFALAVTFVRFYLPFVVFNIVNNLSHHLYRGVKKMGILIFASFFGCAVRIAVSAVLANAYGMPGFYAGWVISWFAEAAFSLTVYFTGKWIPKELRGRIRIRRAR